MSVEVPNKFPDIKNLPYKIALVGEAPGKDEEQMVQPFIGPTGHLLKQLLSSADILSTGCLLSNVSQVRAPGDNAGRLPWDGWQIQSGLKRLRRDIEVFDPNLCVLMGSVALKAAGKADHSILKTRGSLFICQNLDSPFFGRKCLATIHPASLFRQWDLMPLFQFDLKRARSEGTTKELVLPERHFELDLTADELCERLNNWPAGQPASIDIEGGIEQGITCIAIADSPLHSIIVDYVSMGDDVKPRVALAVNRFLRDPSIPKILQNSLYDNMCLSWKHGMPIANVVWDTMLSGWETYCELPKGLDTQASIWTKEPYYKFERKIMDHRTHLAYCCKDASVTYEIAEAHKQYFEGRTDQRAEQHFRFNMSLLNPLLYMQLRGIRFDQEKANEMRLQLNVEQAELQTFIERDAKVPVNCNSPKQLAALLYQRLGYATQYKKEGGIKTSSPTTDSEALLTLLKQYNADIIYNILLWKQKDKLRQQLEVKTDADGRLRTSYNVVGTPTGRVACYKSNTGSGFNLQTVMKKVRPAFVADEDCYIAQIDLSGADGWTVAAHGARLGDDRMLEDYFHGVKPAKFICVAYLLSQKSSTIAAELARMPSAQLNEIILNEEPNIQYWLYHSAKCVQHGSSYGMGRNTMSSNILKLSWKFFGEPVYVAPKDCIVLQDFFFLRYHGVQMWQSWVKMQLEQKGWIESASGHVRHFFGRRRDNSTLQAAYSHEPQANTTYATNLALSNLWNDPDNRHENDQGILHIEPLHQVHDAVLTQFKKAKAEWAVGKHRHYFNNTLHIAGRDLVIPFEGEYGNYWGDNSGGIITMQP